MGSNPTPSPGGAEHLPTTPKETIMDFEAVSLATAPKAVREGTYSDELKASVTEAWQAQLTLGAGYALKATFPTEEAKLEWLRKAQAYGKTQDLFVSKAKSVKTAENVLAFTVQVESERQRKIAERKSRANVVAELKDKGYVIPRGRGANEAIDAALEDIASKAGQ